MFGNILHFTLIHVLLSVVGMVAGLVVLGGLMSGKRFDGWAAVFLVTTALTNLTGFGFPFATLLPSHIVGGISLVILPIVAYALYAKGAAGPWRRVFNIGSGVALYLNVFVLVAQLFAKVPAMRALAPQQKELPFALTQLLVLVLFVILGRAANRGYAQGA
jgi:hypothetical protein